MKRNNAGFTLIEVLISIVILGLIVVPVCSGLLVSVRINAKAEQILEAKLAVSSAVETMMAKGIEEETFSNTSFADVKFDASIEKTVEVEGEQIPVYYKVTVTSTVVDTITVETYIHAAEKSTSIDGGGTE